MNELKIQTHFMKDMRVSLIFRGFWVKRTSKTISRTVTVYCHHPLTVIFNQILQEMDQPPGNLARGIYRSQLEFWMWYDKISTDARKLTQYFAVAGG